MSARAVKLTQEQINAFLSHQQNDKNCAKGTADRYRQNLTMLYNALPKDKRIRRDTLVKWRKQLLEEGYAVRTVNVCISAANSLLNFMGLREFQLMEHIKPQLKARPELTRAEYLRMLQTARILRKERVYLLIKLFATTGLSVQKLTCVTVEAALKGEIEAPPDRLPIPACLQTELLDFVDKNGPNEGPMFVTRDGKPLCRTNVSSSIRQLCIAAQVPPEKGNPVCLKRLYQATRQGIEDDVRFLIEHNYTQLLEREQREIGWKEDGGCLTAPSCAR